MRNRQPGQRPGGGKGRSVTPDARERVIALLGDAPRRRDLLIEHLHLIQDADGCLRAPMLAALAEAMRLSQAEVFEVASFYHHFDIVREGEPEPPALTVRVCDSLSCAMAGALPLADRLAERLGDGVRVQRVPCVGRCAEAPVAVVGRRPVPHATADAVCERVALADTECPVPPQQTADPWRLWSTIAVDWTPERVFAELDAASLRGMGGAGFPTGRKWRIVAGQPGPRHLVVNADEGEPGTFKDRYFLERHPRQVLQGMLVAAWAVGCDDCYIYLRDEYPGLHALLRAEIAALQAQSSLPLPAIHLRRGAGAYVCGEESALIASIEGERGLPRLRPPYVAEVGLFGRPTLVNNVETLYWVSQVLEHGAAAFAAQGRHGRRGMRAFSVSGRVRDPGVKLAPAGTTLRELVDEHCGGMADGHRLHAYLPGGASGGILPASLADLPLDFDTLQAHGCFIGSAAIIVLSEADSLSGVAANLMRFFRDESCGQCTPCRLGTARALEMIERGEWDPALLGALCATMADASICGLGQAAPNPVLSVLRHFPAAAGNGVAR